MTGFRLSRKSSDNRKDGMLTCRIVVDMPMRSKTDSEATQPLKYHHVPNLDPLRRRSVAPAMSLLRGFYAHVAPIPHRRCAVDRLSCRAYMGRLSSWLGCL